MGKLDDFVPIIGELKIVGHVSSSKPLLPHIMYIDAPKSSKLQIVVTDFKLSTWMAVKSVIQLEDMKDNIGIPGSWSEFLEYVTTSMKSRETKIVFEGQSTDDGPASAKVVAEKSKGMPLVCFHLDKLVGVAAVEATGNVSQELFKKYKSERELLVKEQEDRYRLSKSIAAEKRDFGLIWHTEEHQSEHINERSTCDSLSMSKLQQTQGKMVDLPFGTNPYTIKRGHYPKGAQPTVPTQIVTPPPPPHPLLGKQEMHSKKRFGEASGHNEASKKYRNNEMNPSAIVINTFSDIHRDNISTEDIQMIHSRDEKEVDTTLRLAIGNAYIHELEHLSAKDVRINSLEKSLKKYKDAAVPHQQQVADIQKKATDEIDLAKKEIEHLRKLLDDN